MNLPVGCVARPFFYLCGGLNIAERYVPYLEAIARRPASARVLSVNLSVKKQKW